MNETRIALWSRYLIFFILAVLPLERIPSLELTSPLHMTVRLSQVAGLILIGLNLPLMWQKRRQLVQNPWRWLVAFWLVCLIAALMGHHLSRSLSVSAFTIFAGVLAWAVALRFERNQLGTYFKIIVVSALAVCAFGFYQFFGDLLGLPTWATGLRDAYTKAVFGFPRIQSTGLEPLYFGDYLLIPCGLLLLALVRGYRRKLASWALLPMATIVWLTVSRGAMVALGIMATATLLIAVYQTKLRGAGRIAGVMVASVGLAFGLLYLGTHVVVKTKTAASAQAIQNFSKQSTNITNGESSEGRAVTRDLAIKAFVHHPILGIGPGNFGVYASQQMPERFTVPTTIVNNEPLEILAETGLAGMTSLAAFILLVVLAVHRAVHRQRETVDYVMAGGLVLALVGIAAQYLTFSTLYITHIWVAIGLLAGLAAVTPKPKKA